MAITNIIMSIGIAPRRYSGPPKRDKIKGDSAIVIMAIGTKTAESKSPDARKILLTKY